MSLNNDMEELLKDADAGKEAANRRIAGHFAGADFDPDGRVRARVGAAMRAAPAAPRHGFRLAMAACAAVAVAALLLHRRPAPETLISPDWRADYNYPAYYSEVSAQQELPSPDWRADYNFPSFGM